VKSATADTNVYISGLRFGGVPDFFWILRQAEEDVHSYMRLVIPTETLDVIKADPDDNRILECAVAAKSDYIFTGDMRHILPLGQYSGIPIIKVAEFLRLLP
jgi:predicted nucleic acid-binding protein